MYNLRRWFRYYRFRFAIRLMKITRMDTSELFYLYGKLDGHWGTDWMEYALDFFNYEQLKRNGVRVAYKWDWLEWEERQNIK